MPLKSYEDWHFKKSQINSLVNRPSFHEREVWWAVLGHNVGDEEDGKSLNFARPVLIVKKFNRSLFYAVPLSTSLKRGKYYKELTVKGQSSVALLSHLRDYDAKRLMNMIGTIPEVEFIEVRLALAKILVE